MSNIATRRSFVRRDQQRDEFYLERSGHLQDREEGEDKGRSEDIVGRNLSCGDAVYQASRMSSKHKHI